MTIVYLVHNRREELRRSLRQMLFESDYGRGSVDVIVVDNASTDGSAEMIRRDFPQVRLIDRGTNIGVPAWNDGYSVARGEWVLTLDDDCYLRADGLTRAVDAARRYEADLVSFKVVSAYDHDYVFSDEHPTGLLSFWGCAWMVRRDILAELGGFDPRMFIWANELEFMLRFYDRGYRHLHLPDVVAEHISRPPEPIDLAHYLIDAEHQAYVAAKLLRRREAAEALFVLLLRGLRTGLRDGPDALMALPRIVAGFIRGLGVRRPVGSAELSRAYRHNLECFAPPWVVARPATELIRALPGEVMRREFGRRRPVSPGRRAQFYAVRPRFYPLSRATLEFGAATPRPTGGQ